MLKIYVNIEIQPLRFENELRLSQEKNILKNRKIELVSNIENSNLVIFLLNSKTNLKNLPDKYNFLFSTNKPVIILERLDSSVTWIREFSKIKNLKAIIKNRIIRPSNFQNNQLYNGRYHSYLIYDLIKNKNYKINDKTNVDISTQYYKKLIIPEPIDENNLNKILCIAWDLYSTPFSFRMIPYREKEIDFKSKNIDIFCVHGSNKHKEMIGWARTEVFKILNNIKQNNKKLKIITNKLKPKKYIDYFLRSKLCIACWGHGEWVHMDGYAMYSGVILIKPNSDYVKMFPDIYRPYETYIPCKPDFSDLEEVITKVLNNYDSYKEMLINNRKLMMLYDEEKCLNFFWDKILEIYKTN
jgi:hypothetical protein